MKRPVKKLLLVLSPLLLATEGPGKNATPAGARVASHADIARASLLLERATYGPRPGDLDAVLGVGVDEWLDRQLHPERIDDATLEKELAQFPDLDLSTDELLDKYPRPTKDEKKERKERRDRENPMEGPRQVYLQLGQAKLLRAVDSSRQLEEVLTDFWFNHFNVYARKDIPTLLSLPAYERDVIRPRALGKFHDLLLATAQSPAMLRYLDNWSSTREGFNPRETAMRAAGNDAMPGRRRAGGGFARGLGGGPRPIPAQDQQKRKWGLNENYARELMELHTLGVDGGYTQTDVREVARCFTGWTVLSPERVVERFRERRINGAAMKDEARREPMDGRFHFLPQAHDAGPKTVLGKRIDEGGMEDGLTVLRMLAASPTTARFVCGKLARRFVSDHPSEELVAEMAETWTKTDGDIRAVLHSMFHSPRFVEEGQKRDKVKTPLELVASSIRATGARITWAPGLVKTLQELGMPLYMCQPPTGYDEDAATWLSAGSTLNRIRFVGQLMAGQLPGVSLPEPPSDPSEWASELLPEGGALSGDDSATLKEALAEFASLKETGPRQEMALLLASPAFQRQ